MDWFCSIRAAKINLMREMITELTVEEVRKNNAPNCSNNSIIIVVVSGGGGKMIPTSCCHFISFFCLWRVYQDVGDSSYN